MEDESSQELPNDLPADAVEFNGHHYYVYSVDTVQTWDEAKAYCEAQGGYLATITSPEEDKFLYDYLIRSGYESAKFGLTDQNENGAWQWVTGEQSVYSNWHAGEPNHQGGYEHYGMYYRTYRDGSWNDGSDDASVFLCEWGEHNGSIVQLTVTTPQPTDTLDAANTADLTDAGKQTAASDITPPLQREALVAKPPADGRSTLCFNFISRVMELDVGDLRTVLLPEMIDYIIFSSDISIAPQDVADVSFNEDGTVLAWITVDPDITITVHVAGDGIIWLSDGVDMFNGCWELKKIDFGNCVCTTGVVETARMFADCKKLTSLDLSGFDTSSVINMSDMFYGCESLTELNLSGFNTANVNNMAGMFYGCKNITSLDLSELNTGKVTNMHSMFENCTSLTDVNLSGLDTSNVQFMTSMFRNCSALQTLDLSSFHTGSVSAMDYLFSDCTALRKLNLSSFDMANVKNVKEMFKFCTSLETPELGNCDRLSSEKLMDTYQHRHLTNFDCLADAKTGDFIELNVDPPGWRKLGEDENHYYLLYGDYLPNSYISKWIKAGYIKTDTKYITLVGDYGVYFERATDSDMNAFLLDEGNWVALHDQFLEAFTHHDIRVMGGPTRELFTGKDYMNQQNSLFRPRKAPFDGIIDYLMASEQQRDCEIFNWWGGVSQNVGDGQHALRPVVAVSKQEH